MLDVLSCFFFHTWTNISNLPHFTLHTFVFICFKNKFKATRKSQTSVLCTSVCAQRATHSTDVAVCFCVYMNVCLSPAKHGHVCATVRVCLSRSSLTVAVSVWPVTLQPAQVRAPTRTTATGCSPTSWLCPSSLPSSSPSEGRRATWFSSGGIIISYYSVGRGLYISFLCCVLYEFVPFLPLRLWQKCIFNMLI